VTAASTSDPDRFDGRVAIVTGSGRGLGRHYALALAARGARVVVNGRGSRGGAAEKAVVDEITAAGGEAVHVSAPVEDRAAVAAMVEDTLRRWGRVDILINNAGFVRDRSFAKLDLDDFKAVIDVHLNGAANATRAVWSQMLAQRYGRVVMIVSSAGLAGNFGQAAYGAAKMGLVGLMNTLGLEGGGKNVFVNCLSPVGLTQMNAGILPPHLHGVYTPDKVVPGCLFLASEVAPNRVVLLAGAGVFERAFVTFTCGAALETASVTGLAARFEALSDRAGEIVPNSAQAQMDVELRALDRKS
jgi:NAD(P)-dependent dehydrogenase (short-subunit alcohol dehydrogenase family)